MRPKYKSEIFRFVCSPEERQAIRELAATTGKTESGAVRDLVIEAVKTIQAQPAPSNSTQNARENGR